MTTATDAAVQRAEVSNYEIVNHWFDVAAERLELRNGIGGVLRTPYREMQVQVPVKLLEAPTTRGYITA